MIRYYRAGHILSEGGWVEGSALVTQEGRIVDVISGGTPEAQTEDLGPGYLCPGFFDTHIHGYAGVDVMDADAAALRRMCRALPQTGVTRFLATTLTDSEARIEDACRAVREVAEHPGEGARVEGLFLEGPFFNPKRCGAQEAAHMRLPEIARLAQWQEAAGGRIRKIALAPELSGSESFIRAARRMGIAVALGHSDATYEQAKAAVDAGATIFVHLYNAMSGLHHREPGLVGAGLTLDDCYAELICDGQHVHAAAQQVVFSCRGTDLTVLITDCMRAGGMSDGCYTLGTEPVVVQGGAARLRNGSLAGSVLQMKDAVRAIAEGHRATWEQAIRMASRVPARSVGAADRIGCFLPGAEADFLYFTDPAHLAGAWVSGIRASF